MEEKGRCSLVNCRCTLSDDFDTVDGSEILHQMGGLQGFIHPVYPIV